LNYHLNNLPYLKKYRKKLRNDPTKEELLLWKYLKNKQLKGFKFRRQHSVGNYILDFYCPELKLCIEVDGGGHFTDEGKECDRIRTLYLEGLNIKVIRFANDVVVNNMDGVILKIKEMANI
jgi:very-short-patch-repair endonuclease